MKPHFYYEIPENYEVAKVLDAKDKKVVILMNIFALAIGVPMILFFRNLVFSQHDASEVFISGSLFSLLIFLATLVAYMVLHELTHGLFYKIFTHEKLTFGLSLTVAYCGVPKLFVKRIPSLISTIAPFVIFSIIFGVSLLFITDPAIYFLTAVLFSVHVAGCVGDLWGATIMAFQYRGKKLLVNDTGPKQTYYVENQSL